MFIQTLGEVFMTILYITAILILLVMCYAIITAPFKARKKKEAQEKFAKDFISMLDEIADECIEELEQEKQKETEKKTTKRQKKDKK